ncbi:hypothetical protein [Chryseobacterium sp. EO14]|nr:hypothetical protein [Chryseobacterium sp. EO14]MCQ4142442.1 hypothetical protein [Chryseobacterium sp. EO14]
MQITPEVLHKSAKQIAENQKKEKRQIQPNTIRMTINKNGISFKKIT